MHSILEVTNKEFLRLVQILIKPVQMTEEHNVDSLPRIDKTLLEGGLLTCKGLKGTSNPQPHLVVTHCGYHLLTIRRLQLVVCLLELKEYNQVRAQVRFLTREELPVLLACPDPSVRKLAIDAMGGYN